MQDDDPTVGKAIWRRLSTNAREEWPNAKRNFIQEEVDHQLLEVGIPWFGSLKATRYYFLGLFLFMAFCVILF
ncbi:hypothetical protein K3152_13720 [Qipengyuania sp. 1NDH17]|uniref:Uncharacterized protein n=1 Tax=Qipengyuania polymorpha TaxID=2867234 RepID=A0ABS7J0F9_9SPHN|nr:hypothetical protein [Qipengyuania polymorpha]MBX7459307.1 hypothetical protein [Qipengyuania polymorpha]